MKQIRTKLLLANYYAVSGGVIARPLAFFPCTARESPLETLPEAVTREPVGNLDSPSHAGSSFALSRNDPRPGERLLAATESIGGGAPDGDPN